MEYIERGSLRPLVDHLTLAQIVGVLEGLLAGLQHAASRGIVHRDMKPENVMVTGEGGVKISDFGIGQARSTRRTVRPSRFPDRDRNRDRHAGLHGARAGDMAKEVGPWTDLYALGIMAYEIWCSARCRSSDFRRRRCRFSSRTSARPSRRRRRSTPRSTRSSEIGSNGCSKKGSKRPPAERRGGLGQARGADHPPARSPLAPRGPPRCRRAERR